MQANPVTFPARAFVRALAARSEEGAVNYLRNESPRSEARCDALVDHLRTPAPRYLLVSEFPTAEDFGATGLACCDEATLAAGLHPQSRGPIAAEREGRFSELWRSLQVSGIAGNTIAFPLYPWGPNDPRMLDAESIRSSSVWLQVIVDWYPGLQVLALGARVSAALRGLEIEHATLRISRLSRVSLMDQIADIVAQATAGASTV